MICDCCRENTDARTGLCEACFRAVARRAGEIVRHQGMLYGSAWELASQERRAALSDRDENDHAICVGDLFHQMAEYVHSHRR